MPAMIEGPYKRTPDGANAATFWGIILLSGAGLIFVGLYLFMYFQRGLWAELIGNAAARKMVQHLLVVDARRDVGRVRRDSGRASGACRGVLGARVARGLVKRDAATAA